MNEEAIKIAYDLFVADGYKKSIEEFKTLMQENPKGREVAYSLFVADGYKKPITEFEVLMGVSASPTIAPQEVSVEKKNPIESTVQGQDMESPLPQEVGQNGSLESAKLNSNQISEPVQTLDYFDKSLSIVDEKLIDKEEEEVVKELRYNFADYGFTFEEQGIGDSMKVTAKNGKYIDVDLDPFLGSTESSEAIKLRNFLKENKKENERLSLLEGEYKVKVEKVNSQKELDSELKGFNEMTQNFDEELKSYLERTTALEEKKKNNINDPNEINALKEEQAALEKLKNSLVKKQESFITQGARLDKLAADYTAMKSKEGTFFGGIYNAILDGWARQSASMANIATDLMTYFADNAGANPESYKEDLLKIVEEKKLIPKGKTIEELRGLGIDELTEVLGGDTNDIIFMLESLPIAGPGALPSAPTPKSSFDIAHSAVLDKYRKQVKYGDRPYRNRFSNAAATTDLDMGLVDASRVGLREVVGDDETTVEWSKMKKEEFWMGSVLGLTESLPAMIGGAGPVGWAQRTAQMTAQVSDHVYEEMSNNPEFDNISEAEKSLVVAPIAIAVGTLESLGLRNMISQKGLLNGILARAFTTLPKGASAKTFRQFVEQDVKSMAARGLLTVGGYAAAEFETGAAQEIAEVGVKDIYNYIKEKDMFVTPESAQDYIYQVLRAGAQEAVGGFIMGVPGGISSAARGQDFTTLPKEVFEMFEGMSKDENFEQLLDAKLKQQTETGEITEAKAKEIKEDYLQLSGLLVEIPETYTAEQKQEALGLLYNKNKLENFIGPKDPKLVKPQQAALDKINLQLEAIGSSPSTNVTEQDGVSITEQDGVSITEQDDVSITEQDGVTQEDRTEIDLFFSDQEDTESEKISPNIVINTKGLRPESPINNRRNVVVALSKRAANSVKRILPNTKFLLHETNEEFVKYAPEGRGYYDVANNTVHINLSNATKSTVGHEVFHAVLIDKVKNNDAFAQKIAYNMMQSVRKTLPVSSPIRKRIDILAEQYQNEEAWLQNEESLAELMGILSSEYKSLTLPSKNIIVKWIKSVARKFNIPVGPEFTKTDEDVINLMNTLSGKVGKGFEVTEADLTYFNNEVQGISGDVGKISVNRQAKGVDSTPVKDDPRPWVRRLVTDIKVNDLVGQNFVTNMYDFTNSGITELGNGLTLDLLGGRNYVAYIMEKTGKNLGDVSNLAAFNSKENAEGFIKNAIEGKASLFAPHSGTQKDSWQFQQHIFAAFTELVLDNDILSNDELIDMFSETLKSKKGVEAFDIFRSAYVKNKGADIASLEQFKANPLELVELLNVENNYSPEMRKGFNQKISTNKKLQAAIGVKNAADLVERLSDPLNKNSSDFDIMTFVKFDPSMLEIKKTTPGEVDHHPSFGWTILSKIEGIYQPDKFYKTFNLTDVYTKYNLNETVVSSKTQMLQKDFEVQNIRSSAGSIPKIATVARQQKTVEDIAKRYQMNIYGFFPNGVDAYFLKRELSQIPGYTLKQARVDEYGRGGNFYIADSRGRKVNPYKGRLQKTITEVINEGREGGFKEATIKDYLIRSLGFGLEEVKAAMSIEVSELETLPDSFGNIKGGIKKGVILWNRVQEFRQKLTNKNDRNTRLTPAEIKKKISDYKKTQRKTYKTSSQINDEVDAYKEKITKEGKSKNQVTTLVNKFRQKQLDARDALRDTANKNVLEFSKNENKKNNRKAPLMSEQEIIDKTIEFLEVQPEYIAEGDSYVAQGETRYRVGMSSQQAKMITEFQKTVGIRPSQGVAEKLRVARFLLSQRAKAGRDIAGIKRELKNFIRKTIPSELYSKKEVMDLINKISIADETNIDNLFQEVVDFTTTKIITSLESDINSILSGKYEESQGGRLKGKRISLKARERIEAIKKNILPKNSSAEDLLEKINELQKEFNELSIKENPTDETFDSMLDIQAAIQINDAALRGDIDIQKLDALDIALSNLKSLLSGGRTQLKEELRLQHEEYVRQREYVYEDVTGEPLDDSENVDIQARERTRAAKALSVKGKIGSLLSKINNAIIDGVFGTAEALDGLMDKISSLPGEMFGGRTQEIVTDKVDEASRENKERKMIVGQAIQDKLMELYGSKWRKRARLNRIDTPTGIYINEEAVKKAQEQYAKDPSSINKKLLTDALLKNELKVSQNKLYYLYNQYKDPANHPAFESVNMYGLEAYSKTDSKEEFLRKQSINRANAKRVMDSVESQMTKETKTFADWQVNELFPALYLHYNSVYKEIYRTNLPWNQFYAGRIYREGVVEQPLDLLSGQEQYNTSVGSPSTKFRVNNDIAIKEMDGTDALVTYVNDMEYFAAFAKPMRDINKLFTNKLISSAISDIHGDVTLYLIKDSIQKIANKGVRTDLTAGFINGMNNVFILSRLALSPVVMIKQMSSFITYSNDIGYANWIYYAAKSLPDVITTFKEIRNNSVYLKDRYSNSMMRQIESYSETSRQEFIPNSAKDFALDFLMFTTKFGDATAIYMGGIPNYNYYKAQYKKANPKASEKEIIDYAIKKFERDTKRTQQSGDLQDRDLFQTSNPLVRAANMFLTTPKQYLRKEIQAVRGLYRKASQRDINAGKGTLVENLRTLFTYHVVAPVFFQWIAQGLPGMLRGWRDDDDEDLLRAAVLGNINGLFIIGEAFMMAGDFFTGKPWAGESSKSVGVLTIAASLVQKAKKAQATKDPVKQAEAWHKFELELLTITGLPAPTIQKFVDNYKKIGEGGEDPGVTILRLLNYSDYQIEGPPEAAAPKPKPMSKETMKVLMPELYEELQEIKESLKNEEVDMYRKQMKEDREEMIREMYGQPPKKSK
jgi:hypothetical protein